VLWAIPIICLKLYDVLIQSSVLDLWDVMLFILLLFSVSECCVCVRESEIHITVNINV
jgi:hypothetical protein